MSVRRLSVWAVGLLCVALGALVLASVTSADTLPDGRLYEQVTPEEKYGGEVYQPPSPTPYENHVAHSETETGHTFQAAANGSGIAFVGAPTVGGNEAQGWNGGNEYIARRTASGVWTQVVLSPEDAPSTVFQAFSADLTTAFVNSLEPLSPAAPGFGEPWEYGSSYDVLYSMDTANGESVPFFSTKPPYRTMGAFGTAHPFNRPSSSPTEGFRVRNAGFSVFEGASADDSHLLFAANDALTEASEGRPAAEGGSSPEFEQENNLYESIGGRLRLVNVLPNGTTHANASFGGIETFGIFHEKRLVLSRAISADGSRIFWTDLGTGHIYMRENGATTVEISSAGTYQTATSDGSTVFYTNGDLYAYDVGNHQTTDLTPGVGVERIVGASENGEYVYYVTGGGELELWHDGTSSLVRKGTPAEAEVTPDGHSLVFSVAAQVFVYEANSGTLYCASCTSHGTSGALIMTNNANVYQTRWISADGSRVFFVSAEGLVPQDTNDLEDVYEWERPGSGGCAENAGCVYLLSGGTSTAYSSFLDASENGDDVFIVTRAKLVGSDEDDLFDAYDVRVGSELPAPPACTGTGCQGVPSPTPIFATPSSVTFEGVGNFAAPAQQKTKPKAGKKPNAKKKGKKKNGKVRTRKKKGKSARTSRGVRTARAGTKGGRS